MSEKKAKTGRPSLKNFLSTGKVSVESEPVVIEKKPKKTPKPKAEPKIEKISTPVAPDFSWVLKLMSPEDLETWKTILESGAEFREEKLDFAALRETFRNMDRVQFTLYVLESEGAAMRTIRSGVQIREPYVFFLLWDDNGIVKIYNDDREQ